MLDMIMLRCSDIEVRLPWEYNPVLPAVAQLIVSPVSKAQAPLRGNP